MAINPGFAGRTFPAAEPYEVTGLKVREFADAIGDLNPLYRSRAAAQEAGFPDVIAPPTFPIVISVAANAKVLIDPDLNLNYAMVVHGEQRFEFSRPLVAGDVVTAQSTISSIRTIGKLSMMTTTTEIRTVEGEHVCTAHSTLVERGSG